MHMAKNISIYVSDKDEAIWKEARRFVRFYRDQSLSAYLTEHLQEYVRQKKTKYTKNKD
jgi:hypothetical protein